MKALCRQIKELPAGISLYVLTPTHGNLGDHAIAYAAFNLLKHFSIPYFELPDYQIQLLDKYKQLKVLDQRNILITGGGFLGTLWFSAEQLMRDIIINAPNSSIILMPNTIYYENSEWGKKELEKSISIYNKHNSLHIFAREQISYDYMKKIYNRVFLVPDLVLSLDKKPNKSSRQGCLLCLRNDIEKTLSDKDTQILHQQLNSLFDNKITITDMVVDHRIPPEERNNELNIKFHEFQSSEVVVTDRLHGMIFSAVTGTPCIVLNSLSPKLAGSFKWIEDTATIIFINSPSEICAAYDKVQKINTTYNHASLQAYYDFLGNYILKTFKKK